MTTMTVFLWALLAGIKYKVNLVTSNTMVAFVQNTEEIQADSSFLFINRKDRIFSCPHPK